MAYPLICIVGPTASGKTKLATQLFNPQQHIFISADSRQVYRYTDIVTGKDHDLNFTFLGLDLVNPDEVCSVATWYQAIISHLELAWKNRLIPIVVGGTGLYFQALTQKIDTLAIPPNKTLRQKLVKLSLTQLQNKLKHLDHSKFTLMNQSDINNPRRLIRAIEVANYLQNHPLPTFKHYPTQPLYIGLKIIDNQLYRQHIRQRVISRLELGALNEAKTLLKSYPLDLPAFSSLGYPFIFDYLQHRINYQQLIDNWTQSEYAYAQRQLTWFKKNKTIKWFDPLNKQTPFLVESLIKDWYSKL